MIEDPEPNEAVIEEIILRLKRFPAIINAAKLGLDESVGLLADAAVERIGDVDAKITALETALGPHVPANLGEEFELGTRAARQSLTSYKDWLTVSRGRFSATPSIGEHRLRWYLGHVALIPRSPDAIVVETELVLAQTGAQQALDRQRFAQTSEGSPLDALPRLLQMLEINRSELQTYLGSTGLLTAQFA